MVGKGAQKCSKCHQPRKGHICPQANQFPPGMASSSASLSDFVGGPGDPVDMANMGHAVVAEMLAAANGAPNNGPIVSPKLPRGRNNISKANRNQNLATALATTDDDLVDVDANDLSSTSSMLLVQNHQQSPSMHQQQQNQHHQNLQTQQPQHQVADLLTQSFLQNNAIDISMTGADEEESEEDIEEEEHAIDMNGNGDMDGDDSAGLHDEVRMLEDGGSYAIYSGRKRKRILTYVTSNAKRRQKYFDMSKSLLQKADDIATTTGALVFLYLARPEYDSQQTPTSSIKNYTTPALEKYRGHVAIADQAARSLFNAHKEALNREQVASQLEQAKQELEKSRERVRELERDNNMLRGGLAVSGHMPPGGST